MSEAEKKNRPQFTNLNLFTQVPNYRLPLAGIVSIAHRISGALIFILIPFILYLLDKSLSSEISFAHFKGVTSNWCVKLIVLALSWGFLHHFCAGIRYLVMDLHIGVDKENGRKSALIVFVVSLALTLGVAWKLFGAANGQ